MLDKSLIPKGIYCSGCPYFTSLILSDEELQRTGTPINIPYCLYLRKGSMDNNWIEGEFERLKKLLNQTEDQLWDKENGLLGLDLLWDGCKECGINTDL